MDGTTHYMVPGESDEKGTKHHFYRWGDVPQLDKTVVFNKAKPQVPQKIELHEYEAGKCSKTISYDCAPDGVTKHGPYQEIQHGKWNLITVQKNFVNDVEVGEQYVLDKDENNIDYTTDENGKITSWKKTDQDKNELETRSYQPDGSYTYTHKTADGHVYDEGTIDASGRYDGKRNYEAASYDMGQEGVINTPVRVESFTGIKPKTADKIECGEEVYDAATGALVHYKYSINNQTCYQFTKKGEGFSLFAASQEPIKIGHKNGPFQSNLLVANKEDITQAQAHYSMCGSKLTLEEARLAAEENKDAMDFLAYTMPQPVQKALRGMKFDDDKVQDVFRAYAHPVLQ